MSFNSGNLVTSSTDRVRLLVGDISEIPFLDDTVYEYTVANSSSELIAAITILESIISIILLDPLDTQTGDASQGRAQLAALEKKLIELKAKRNQDSSGVSKVPIRIHAGRQSWSDFDFFNK